MVSTVHNSSDLNSTILRLYCALSHSQTRTEQQQVAQTCRNYTVRVKALFTKPHHRCWYWSISISEQLSSPATILPPELHQPQLQFASSFSPPMSAFAASASSFTSSFRQFTSHLYRTARTRSTPLITSATTSVRRWSAPIAIGAFVYAFGVDPDLKRRIWQSTTTSFDPLREWRVSRTHGRRERHLLAHYSVAASRSGQGSAAGEILELGPGAGGIFNALAVPPEQLPYAVPIAWRGIDTHDAHWKAGRLQHSAESHCGVPSSAMQFDSCSNSGKSVLEMLRAIPEASVANIVAMKGLRKLIEHDITASSSASSLSPASASSSSPSFSSSSSSSPPSSSISSQSPPSSDDYLRLVVSEIYRILRPGGRFFFKDEGVYNTDPQRTVQQLTTLIKSPLSHTPLVPIPQTLPLSGFNEAHIEQWPDWLDPRNSRKGIRTLRVLEVDGNVQLDGMKGTHPCVVGIATKSINAPTPTNTAVAAAGAGGPLANLFR